MTPPTWTEPMPAAGETNAMVKAVAVGDVAENRKWGGRSRRWEQ